MPSIPRSLTSVARTAAAAVTPNVVVRPGKPATRAIARSSAAFTTSSVAGVAPSRISAFASAMASTESKNAACTSATLVHTRKSGSAIRTRVRISPA